MSTFGGFGGIDTRFNSLSLLSRGKKIIVAVDYGTTFTGSTFPLLFPT